jgi:lipid II isoglutaminyl synthase (glutamine-hydrolysing)
VSPTRADSAVRIVVVHPDLLGTYGDGGNGVILARRLLWRGLAAELVEAPSGAPVPATGDVYCLGGGEDGPEARSAAELAPGNPLGRALESGAAVLAVCAGFQVIGSAFPGAGGSEHAGIGLIDVRSRKGGGRRAVGELVTRPDPGLGLPDLTGYENHGAVTELGRGVEPLARVVSGVGNGTEDGAEGARSGRVFCTYMHGPVLARNPALADAVLESVTGALAPLDDAEAEDLRSERLAAAGRSRPGLWRRVVARG